MARTLLEAVLRRAILQGGSIGYNPDMYDYGFADNIPPSEEFNNKLRQYGTLRYSSDRYLFGCPVFRVGTPKFLRGYLPQPGTTNLHSSDCSSSIPR